MTPIINTKIRPPKRRREYKFIPNPSLGLNYERASTQILDGETPGCEEVTFRNDSFKKASGTTAYAGTDVTPILTKVMYMKTYIKNNESQKLMAHTLENVYAYSSTSDQFECLTEGVVVEDCEDVWVASVNVTASTSTDKRKGSNSVSLAIAAAFTTGVVGYEDFASADLSGYDHLHLYVKSDIAVADGVLSIRLSEQNGGGTGATYADYNLPALSAGVWKEISLDLTNPDVDDGGSYPTDLDAVLSISLVANSDPGEPTILLDDVLATKEMTGDEDDAYTSCVQNDFYIFSNGIAPLKYWDQTAATVAELPGTSAISTYSLLVFGERVVAYRVGDNPRRVKYTIVGGISTVPAATDWSNSGSGDEDLDSYFGDDVIMTALRLGNYVVIYGKNTIVMQEHTGDATNPFSYYTRVTGKGTPSRRGVVSVGNFHVMLGWDDVYVFNGGQEAESIGRKVRDELFRIINPQYIHRSFVRYLREKMEVRIYFPKIGSESPDTYFSYSLRNGSWTRGSRSYTAGGSHVKKTSETWETFGEGVATWDSAIGRWDDVVQEQDAPTDLYGTSDGQIHQDLEASYNLIDVAISSRFETKDFVVGERYLASMTNWFEFTFEAIGHTVDVSYSTDQGVTWSTPVTFTLTTQWTSYSLHLSINNPNVRFLFSNSELNQTYDVRNFELGYVRGSDRGV